MDSSWRLQLAFSLWLLSMSKKKNPKGSTSVAVGETYGEKCTNSTEPEGFNINSRR